VPTHERRESVRENQLGGLDSGIISSIELWRLRRHVSNVERRVILVMTQVGLSEILRWHARAGQARRMAGMLSPRDAALVEAYARECEDCARAAATEHSGAAYTYRATQSQQLQDQTLGSPDTRRLPKRAA
jgi:hypothetical protein